MRAADMGIDIIRYDDKPAGICLGSGGTTEHEMGISSLQYALGIDDEGKRGLQVYQSQPISRDDERLRLYERKKPTKTLPAELRLTFHNDPRVAAKYSASNSKEFGFPRQHPNKGIATAWGLHGFCIRAFDDEAKQLVRDIYSAFLAGDALVSLGTVGIFAGSGLMITINDRVPQRVEDELIAKQEDAIALKKAALKTKIEKLISDEGLKFYALKPSWVEEGSEIATKTQYPVHFWLNPMSQNDYKSGWFTVEELRDWLKGKGPVLRRPKVA